MILVTGGTGLLGSFVVQELQRRGQSARVFTRSTAVAQAHKLGVEVARGDLDNAESLRHAMAGVIGIVHAACTFTSPAVDVAAMRTLLDAWEQGSFVFISSVDVYGYPDHVPVEEEDQLMPSWPADAYGRAKVCCEQLLQEAAQSKGRGDWSVLRPPHIWGPDPRSVKNPASPVKLLYDRIRQDEPVVLPGATKEEWSQYGDDWVDARELAWIAGECLQWPLGAPANAINRHFSLHDVCVELKRRSGSDSQIIHKDYDAITNAENPRKDFFAQRWSYSGQRLQQRLGFQPRYQWQETLAEIVRLDH
jgi:nucleoside-diphosphate-sugar epimerase